MEQWVFEWIKYGLNFFELLACVTGIIYWKKIEDTFWKWFPIYLFVILCVEFTGKALNKGINPYLYSYFGIPFTFFFFFWLFYKYFQHTKAGKWTLLGIATYAVVWLMEMIFLRGTKFTFFSLSYTFGNVILAVFVLLFFIRFINSDRILEYRSDMMFWVCCGLLIFYLGSLPLYGLWNTIATKKFKSLFHIYWVVHMFFDYLMYLFFTIAFIWGKPK